MQYYQNICTNLCSKKCLNLRWSNTLVVRALEFQESIESQREKKKETMVDSNPEPSGPFARINHHNWAFRYIKLSWLNAGLIRFLIFDKLIPAMEHRGSSCDSVVEGAPRTQRSWFWILPVFGFGPFFFLSSQYIVHSAPLYSSLLEVQDLWCCLKKWIE